MTIIDTAEIRHAQRPNRIVIRPTIYHFSFQYINRLDSSPALRKELKSRVTNHLKIRSIGCVITAKEPLLALNFKAP